VAGVSENLLGEFLRARRELARPQEHGLPDLGRRRVPGLRREEVAMLAGISAEYYIRLERGRDRNPSAQVLDALSRVLGLDAESRSYAASLVTPSPSRTEPDSETPPPGILRLLHATPDPAFLINRYLDVLAANRAVEVLHGEAVRGNMVRHLFLHAGARDYYPDWEEVALEAVASLRGSVGGHLDDPRFTRLVGELSLKSADFVRLWARHDVKAKTSGTKRIVSPAVGPVTISWEGLAVTSAPGLQLITYSAESGTPSAAALERVASLAAGR
jgi:transcriptional regulator with XRE-family HTH domain